MWGGSVPAPSRQGLSLSSVGSDTLIPRERWCGLRNTPYRQFGEYWRGKMEQIMRASPFSGPLNGEYTLVHRKVYWRLTAGPLCGQAPHTQLTLAVTD